MAGKQTVTKHVLLGSILNSNEYADTPPGTYAPGTSSAGTAPAVAAPAVTAVSGGMNLIGVNISGGEYGPTGTGNLGYDYIYPSASEISYYASKGMTVIRVPFQLERLEPNANGPLDPSQVADLQQVISTAAANGLEVILDPHNYGSAWGNLIGSSASPVASFANFWSETATAFKGDSNVIFGLMNEPNAQTPQQWAQADNAAIAAIRQTGATQEILVPGSNWTGAWSWTSGNSAAINPTTIVDPLHNYAFEVHQYLDSDGSGTDYSPITDPTIGVSRLTAITQWATQTGAKLFLGEFGVPSDPRSLAAMQAMLTYMEQNSSAWQGATYWAGGQWLGSYPLSIEPQNGQDAAQMGVLQRFAPGGDLASGYQPPVAGNPNDLVLNAPAAESVNTGGTVSLSGVSIQDAWAAQQSGMMTLTVTDTAGALVMNGTTYAANAAIHLTGTEAALNADLASLSYVAGHAPGADTVTIAVANQAGVGATAAVGVTIAQPVVTLNPGQTSTAASNSAIRGTGSFNILISGSFNTIAFAGGQEVIRAPQGHNVISTGSSNDRISLAGAGNTIDAGGGANVLSDTGTANIIVLPKASQGSDRIYGSVLQNGDLFDLRPALAATGWDGTSGSLSNWLGVQTRQGNTLVYLKNTASGPAYAIATLERSTASLAQILQHALI